MTIPRGVIDDANSRIADIIGRYVNLKPAGPEYKALCPFHDERTPSFTVVPHKQMFHCFGCGASGDAIQFVMQITGASFRDAIETITGKLPEPVTEARLTTAKPRAQVWQHAGTPPDSAPAPDFMHWRHGTPSDVYTYHDADGVPMGYVCRFPVPRDDGEMGKETVPVSWCVNTETGEFAWRWLSFAEPRSMYNLHLLGERPADPVMVVEGEKSADAVPRTFPSFVPVTWPGGGKSVKKADFKPLAGRRVTLWPDADLFKYPKTHPKAGQIMPPNEQPGYLAMRDVWIAIRDIAAEVRIVPPMPGAPHTWDLADPAPDGVDVLAYARSSVTDAAAFFGPDIAPDLSGAGPDIQTVAAEIPDAAGEPSWPAPLDIFAEFPAPPIHADMLPAAIAEYATECGELIGVDPSMIAIPAIVACAAALHDGVTIQPKRHETSWTESARLWCAIVGAPSVRKSPAIRRATKRLRKIDADLAEVNGRLSADYADQAEQYKEAKKEAKKSGGMSVPPPEKPAMARMIVEDITVEALSEVLKDNPRGVMCIQDELTGWFGSMDAYSGGKSGNKDRAAWLQAYNGGFRQVDRIMRGAVMIPNFSVCMIGGIQPDAIRQIAAKMTDDGLMQRFMIVVGKNAVELDRIENRSVSDAFGRLVDTLYAVMPCERATTLSEGAHAIREGLMKYSSEMADYMALPGGLRSHLGKWPGLFARLLLTYHAIECVRRSVHPCDVPVHADTAAQVDRLMRRFLLPHALAYYSDILGASSDLEHARWIAGYVLSRNVTRLAGRDLMQAYRAWRGLDDWRRQRVMSVLEDSGWLVTVEEDKHNKRGASAWVVNPRAHVLFAAKAADECERRARLRDEIAEITRGNG